MGYFGEFSVKNFATKTLKHKDNFNEQFCFVAIFLVFPG